MTALGNLNIGAVHWWRGIAYAPITGKLCKSTAVLVSRGKLSGARCSSNHPLDPRLDCAPHVSITVLVINPLTNGTDTIGLGGLGAIAALGKWSGIAFAPSSGKLYCAPL